MKNQDDNAPSTLVLKVVLDIRPFEDREIPMSGTPGQPRAFPRPGLDTTIDESQLRALLEQAPPDHRPRPHADLCELFLEVEEPDHGRRERRGKTPVSLNDLFPAPPLPAPSPIPPPGGGELEAPPSSHQFLPEDSEADIELTLVIYV